MHISLVGMSNIGKTFCAKNLAQTQKFKHIDCDAIIERKLAPELAEGDHRGIQGMARWMGFPGDFSYRKNSRRYIDCEKETMREALAALEHEKDTPIVLDTTGSVVYCGKDVIESMRAITRVIYFEASEAHISKFFETFIAYPKPVIWGESYAPREGEIPRETLERCYPDLLRFRMRRYKEAAHLVIPFDEVKNHWDDIGTFVLDYVHA